jgi:hypothetical protein
MKLLFISYYYGEDFAAGIQNERFIRAISGNCEELSVVTRYYSINRGEITVVNSSTNRVIKLFENYFLSFLNGVLSFDEMKWMLKVFFYVRKRKFDFDIVHINSSPYLIQLLGFYFKFIEKKKWVMHLLDPISDNSYINNHRLSKGLLRIMEWFMIKHADYVIVNNQRMYDKLSTRYKKCVSKISVLSQISPKMRFFNLSSNQKLEIMHAGTIYGKRNLKFVVKTLCILQNRRCNIQDLKISFIGSVSKSNMNYFLENGFSDVVDFLNPVSHANLEEKLKFASALLLIDGFEDEGLFAPSKLYDYLSYNKIIFAITPNRSVTRDLIQKNGHLCFGEAEEVELANAIQSLLTNRNYFVGSFNNNWINECSAESISAQYCAIINSRY